MEYQRMIPVTIVTGFLGSGKTTLLSSLIKSRQTRRLALLINEFGEVSIDGALINDSVGGDEHVRIHDFPYGLIAYGDDEHFIPTMQAIAGRRANVDHVLIETSGLALPTAVMELLQTPELAGDFILDATLAVVDTPLLLSDQFDRDLSADSPQAAVADSVATLFEQQLEYADVVVLNKIDALDEDALLLAEQRVRDRAPNVRFLELAYNAQLDIRLALGLRLHQPTFTTHNHRFTPIPGSGAPTLGSHARLNGHAHSGLAGHSHGLTTHKHFHEQDPGWLSFVLRSQEPQQAETIKQALIEVAKAEPLLRCKGFILFADQSVLVQGVRTRVTIGSDTAKQSSKESELVFIGYHLNRNTVAELLSKLTGTAWK
ncbi:CobW family GTP-binding protein [Methylobacter tundripaludum]|uniref:Cobalamin synthesis protein P47K n=1 Tax=Methylobacter tundripaludum (strain ATCC BAA-1195 / DSM 17260 / SV96) TaxID=697282 RepID=G3J1Q9_METTV|nr:GTP-binding protein [Methylobacter tundripaludum]EGW19665.1 cobalamin synthesis protein P47K [Methylobacter tundripaludum SV96]